MNRLKPTPALMRCLATTNIIENPNGVVRRVTHHVCRYQDTQMALRRTAAGFLEAEKSFTAFRATRNSGYWLLRSEMRRALTRS